ncbi:MAG: hypothetical protein D6758_13120 [Gammaproteobacteria bacterium]|nr:MAG: hypothetical protein D6758_13120 [Gammaproteobacteria bacterium]
MMHFDLLPVWLRRAPVLLCAIITLLSGLIAGWVRVGGQVDIPAHWLTWHGALLAGFFFPTLIALERAVATGSPILWTAVAGMCGADLLMVASGQVNTSLGMALICALLLFAAHVRLCLEHRALHLWVMTGAILLLASGHLLALKAGYPLAGLPGWGGFLVLTIMAERIELSRARRPDRRSQWLMAACCLFMGAGLAAWKDDGWSQVTAFLGLAGAWAWLWRWDLARLTWRKPGLPGYVGLNVLVAYLWLAIAVIALPYQRDLSIHALMLGYVFTMVMAHAPVIFPAILRRRLKFSRAFYVPAVLLQASLVLRALADLSVSALLLPSATLTIIAIVALFATTLGHLRPQPVPFQPAP